MNQQQLYQAIFFRKSIRRFDQTPLTDVELAGLRDFAAQAMPLDTTIRIVLAELQAADIVNLLPVRAPHYLCLYSEPSAHALLNAGFLLQQIGRVVRAGAVGPFRLQQPTLFFRR